MPSILCVFVFHTTVVCHIQRSIGYQLEKNTSHGCLKENQNAPRPSELLVFVVFFTSSTDRASTIPSNIRNIYIRGCQSSNTWSAEQKKIRGTSTKLQRQQKKNTNKQKQKRQIKKGTRITKHTCQKKIDEGHSVERIWHSASREQSDTLPGSQPCTQTLANPARGLLNREKRTREKSGSTPLPPPYGCQSCSGSDNFSLVSVRA